MSASTYFQHSVYIAKTQCIQYIYNIDYRFDISLCMRLQKEIIKKKTTREKKSKITRKNYLKNRSQ